MRLDNPTQRRTRQSRFRRMLLSCVHATYGLLSVLCVCYLLFFATGTALASSALLGDTKKIHSADSIAYSGKNNLPKNFLTAQSVQKYTFSLSALRMELSTTNSQGTSSGEQEPPSIQELMLRGSLLGAVLFGYPYSGIGMPDISLLIIILYFLIKKIMLKNTSSTHKKTGTDLAKPPPRTPASQQKPWNGDDKRTQESQNTMPEKDTMERRAKATWDALRDQSATPVSSSAATSTTGFDVDDFLKGARTLYVRLQQSWAARDIDDLTPFVTPDMMRILRSQAAANPHSSEVQILLVTASLADTVKNGNMEKASVVFDAVIHEGPEHDTHAPVNVHEVWQFIRTPETGGTWRLDTIGQD